MLQALRDWAPDIVLVNSIFAPQLETRLQASARSVRFVHTFEADCITGSRYHTRPETQLCSHRFGLPCMVRFFSSGCGQSNLPITRWRMRKMRADYRRETARKAVLAAYPVVVVMSAFMQNQYRGIGLANVLTALPIMAKGLGDQAPPDAGQ